MPSAFSAGERNRPFQPRSDGSGRDLVNTFARGERIGTFETPNEGDHDSGSDDDRPNAQICRFRSPLANDAPDPGNQTADAPLSGGSRSPRENDAASARATIRAMVGF